MHPYFLISRVPNKVYLGSINKLFEFLGYVDVLHDMVRDNVKRGFG